MLQILLEGSTCHDIQEVSCDTFACHTHRIGLKIVVYLIFLRGYIQHAHVHQGNFEVFIADCIYQLLRNNPFLFQHTAYRILYRAQ